jgi:UDP-N-acetylmuramoyl-L-alanyl-D-glutamate--2,6-diaminopimelate ligase
VPLLLADLVRHVEVLEVHGDAQVTSVVHDSRASGPGALFCCVPGRTVDGHDHAPAAVAAGAVALLCERFVDVEVAQARVADVRAAMGPVAATFHGHPSSSLDVVGVTGTNGKTTTTLLLRSILEADGRPCGVIGTLSGARTTPEGPELQATLAAMRDEGRRAVAMEVSSHALAMRRADGTRFRVAVFTNLGRDHLDFHPTPEDYFEAKARLFTPELADVGVVNTDDEHGRRLLERAMIPLVPYSLDDAVDLEVTPGGSVLTWRGVSLRVPLGGRFNVANAVAAATAAAELGVDPAVVADGLAATPQVPGRFELVDAGQPFTVVVDYAHTPDALENVLGNARGDGRLIAVFGCGGDRDPGKRTPMGEVASRLADEVVVTSDNPRSEDQTAIIDQIRRGAPHAAIEPDRRAAIRAALLGARPGDVVVVAGKGHETTQTIGGTVLPFDDRVVVREELAALGASRAGGDAT